MSNPVRLPALKLPQPSPHRSNLPQMRLLDELRLRVQVENAVAIPVMARARDQILGMQVGGVTCRGVVGVVADVEPDVDVAVDEGETVRGEVEIPIVVVVVQVGSAGYGIELPLRERPCAPLLRVVDLKDAGNQGRSGCWRDLIGALFGAGAVKVTARRRVGRIGIKSLVLGAKARCAVDRDTITEWEECFFHVLGVITKIGPSLAITVFTEDGVDRCDVLRGIQISDVGAEMKEILRPVCRIPVKLLPCIGWIIHWSADRKSNCHCKVSVIF